MDINVEGHEVARMSTWLKARCEETVFSLGVSLERNVAERQGNRRRAHGGGRGLVGRDFELTSDGREFEVSAAMSPLETIFYFAWLLCMGPQRDTRSRVSGSSCPLISKGSFRWQGRRSRWLAEAMALRSDVRRMHWRTNIRMPCGRWGPCEAFHLRPYSGGRRLMPGQASRMDRRLRGERP